MFGTECDHTFRSLLSCAGFAPILTQKTDKHPGKSQTLGMGKPLSELDRFVAPLESLVRIAKVPQSRGREGQATYPGVSPAITQDERPMALRIIEGDRVFEIFPGR